MGGAIVDEVECPVGVVPVKGGQSLVTDRIDNNIKIGMISPL